MPPFDECCVLIPVSTLEDFPADCSGEDARSLLAAWTALWHPRLLAAAEQTPAWYRADAPPEPPGSRIFVVPTLSEPMVPDQYAQTAKDDADCQWITGADRAEFLAGLGLLDSEPRLTGQHRSVGAEDFFALAYAMLQIQIMTRRLRYTSNLDELHVQTRVIAGAKAFVAGDAQTAIDALHDCFDALAEERDHYFASDPSLIDLTLLSDGTLDSFVKSLADPGEPTTGSERTDTSGAAVEDSEAADATVSSPSVLATPFNVLIDGETAESEFWQSAAAETIRDGIRQRTFGWAGGGPAASVSLDALSFSSAQRAVGTGLAQARSAVGITPPIYARFCGSTPADLTSALINLGYRGLIPIDFAGGSGHGDESKVLWQAGGREIEALTAKPIDAANDDSFLNLASRLGEAIDSGEIATGLLAHWPGQSCQSFDDLRVVASWSLVLGKFWLLDEYFSDGEQPYHHGISRSVSKDAAEKLTHDVRAQVERPISAVVDAFRADVHQQTKRRLDALATLMSGKMPSESESAFARLAAGIGTTPASEPASAAIIVNPHSTASRTPAVISGNPPAKQKHVFASSVSGAQSTVSVDTPALGFATVVAGDRSTKPSLMKRLLGGRSLIADDNVLQNEFMEVVIDQETGGLAGVYSGATRGNRFSMRLSYVSPKSKSDSRMICDSVRIESNSDASATIVTSGSIFKPVEVIPSKSGDSTIESAAADPADRVATFTLRYSLDRGSRTVRLAGEMDFDEAACGTLGDRPWAHYIAARTAVASEAAIDNVLLREKIHRSSSRRIVAPLGVVIDEADRQTLIASRGLPYHRRSSDRFLDTLLIVRGELKSQFEIDYGFDVRQPVAAAQALIAPPTVIPVNASNDLPAQSWIVHTSPKSVLATELECTRRDDGKLVALIKLIQTRSEGGAVALRFCRNVAAACLVKGDATITGLTAEVANVSLPAKPSIKASGGKDSDASSTDIDTTDFDRDTYDVDSVECKQDRVKLSLPGHGIADVLVVFDS